MLRGFDSRRLHLNFRLRPVLVDPDVNDEADRPTLLFLYGPPAVGKLTVAKELAQRRPLRILHNHVTIDPVAEILEFGTPGFWDVVKRFREDLVGSAAKERVSVIYTFVFASGDEPQVARVVDAFERHGGQVEFVQLLAPREEPFVAS